MHDGHSTTVSHITMKREQILEKMSDHRCAQFDCFCSLSQIRVAVFSGLPVVQTGDSPMTNRDDHASLCQRRYAPHDTLDIGRKCDKLDTLLIQAVLTVHLFKRVYGLIASCDHEQFVRVSSPFPRV